jgi:EmrB/QacA subfamily drug resistance transporter
MSKDAVQAAEFAADGAKRWWALVALCLGVLIIVLDTTVVYVALPSISEDLQFTPTSLVWVVNAYTLTFGGCLLLGGRLGDLYDHRKLFLIGLALFTISSLCCGLADTQARLVAARAVQGVCGAVVLASALPLIMKMFTDDVERAKALGVYGFVYTCGGSVGLLLGGTLTGALDWHWAFLINLPIGVMVYVLCVFLLPLSRAERVDRRLDVWGAVTVTSSLLLAVYAIANGGEAGWTSDPTLALLVAAALLMAIFLIIESRVRAPLMPLRVLCLQNLAVACGVAALWAAGASALFFVALYLQLVLGYGPMRVGLAFLPANIVGATLSLGVSAKLVARFGVRKPLGVGMALGAIGLALLARAPVDGNVATDVFPSMILIGVAVGIAFNPLLLAAMSHVPPEESGLASGIVNTVSLMGGALGLALLVGISTTSTSGMLASGATSLVALTGGYRAALLVGASCAGAGALIGVTFLRNIRASEP